MAKSEYLQREEAAKKQLGAKGVKKRVKQLPTAARAFTREMTGIDVSRKGVKVDPFSVAMALPVGKVLKAAKVLRAAGMGAKASQLEARNVAKLAGREAGKRLAKANNPATVFGVGRTGEQVLSDYIRGAQGVGKITREASEGVFPRGTDLAKRALKAKAEKRTAIRESMNYQFPFNRVVNESERIERKYGLTMRTAEEGLRQAAKRTKPRGGR